MDTKRYLYLVGAALAVFVGLAIVVNGISVRCGDSPALIASDGKAYYAWARSAWIDGDVDFGNDYRLLYPPDPLPPESARFTDSGKVLNKTSIGMAILETPGVWLGTLAAQLTGAAQDGVSLPYQVAVCGSLIVFYVAAWLLLYRAWLRLGVAPGPAFLLWLAVLGATNLLHYAVKEPAMTHAAGAAVTALLLYLVSGWKPDEGRTLGQGIAAGAILGLLILIRSANLAILPFMAALLAWHRVMTARVAAGMVIGALALISLQVGATYALWGRLGYTIYPDESFANDWRGVWLGLFSHRHGLFVHHPWYLVLLALNLVALAGPSRRRLVAAGALVSWTCLALGNGLWWCWWFGDSFGHRSFVETIVPLTTAAALGLPAWQRSRAVRGGLVAVLALCILANVYLWTGYLLGRYAPNGDDPLGRVYGWACEREP